MLSHARDAERLLRRAMLKRERMMPAGLTALAHSQAG
jgi:hypothetical protein